MFDITATEKKKIWFIDAVKSADARIEEKQLGKKYKIWDLRIKVEHFGKFHSTEKEICYYDVMMLWLEPSEQYLEDILNISKFWMYHIP